MKTVLSRGSALVESVCLWIPGAFFAQWALRRGLLWTPQRLFWMALFMAWSAEQTLAERFDAARDLLQILFPAGAWEPVIAAGFRLLGALG